MSNDENSMDQGEADGVDGWGGAERRSGRDRRDEEINENTVVYSKRRQDDRRQAQFCYVCGNSFQPTATQLRICPNCQITAMHHGNNARGWGVI